MKKILTMLLLAAMILSLAACGAKEAATTMDYENSSVPSVPGGDEKETEEQAPTILTPDTAAEAETEETESEESETEETESESETTEPEETESEPQEPAHSEEVPDSNWEGAAGYYYNDSDITLEVVLRGTADARKYDLIFYAYEDGRETEVFSVEGASNAKGNELRASKNGVDYLFIYQPDDEMPRIRVKRENSAGSAAYDGLYTIVMG